MKVEQFSLGMSSQHYLEQAQFQRESIQVWRANAPSAPPPPSVSSTGNTGNDVNISASGKTTASEEENLSPAFALMRDILEKTFGFHINLVGLQRLQQDSTAPVAPAVTHENPPPNTASSPPPPSSAAPQWGMRIARESSYSETESFQFSASGQIKTSDGRELSFSLDISMSRHFETSSSETLNFGAAAKDPLMLTLGQDAGVLSGASVSFDLTGDGKNEALPMAGNGGWLVLDRNGDGKVNDRSELFGPRSGDGFAELAQLDEDGNGAVDAGDPLFARLKLWQGRSGDADGKDGKDGKDQLTALKDVQISALLLPHVDADYHYTDESGKNIAQLRKAGVYVSEQGQAGLISQLDINA